MGWTRITSERYSTNQVTRLQNGAAPVLRTMPLQAQPAPTNRATFEVQNRIDSKSRDSGELSADSSTRRESGQTDITEGDGISIIQSPSRQSRQRSVVTEGDLTQVNTSWSRAAGFPLLESIQSNLHRAIQCDQNAQVKNELKGNIEQLKHPLGDSSYLPIHWAIRDKKYKALDALLEVSPAEVLNQKDRRQTAFELACQLGSGDCEALKCFQKHRDNPQFRDVFQRAVYDKRKDELSAEARKIVAGLCKKRIESTSSAGSSKRLFKS